MNEQNSDNETRADTLLVGQDDFSLSPDITSAERRLHMQAFDYWHKLKADREFPLFSELRAEDLAPFKTHSLLLEFNQNGTVVRFLGDDVDNIVDGQLEVGSYLADFPSSSFASALLEQFSEPTARTRAAEFEFIEEPLSCRGIMLPYSRDGEGPHFVMVVASFRRSDPEEETESISVNPDTNMDALNGLLSAGQRAADTIVHMDNGNRTSLYAALASALALYEGAQKNPAAYSEILENSGLKAQLRAPYTPVLKMVFGASYDKTRITEYAAAISYGVRQGQTSDNLADFLAATPGGIKGCVQEERTLKRREAGTSSHNRQQEAVAILKGHAAVPLLDITSEDEFCLLLARRDKNGGVEVLGQSEVSKVTLDAAVRQMASKTKMQ